MIKALTLSDIPTFKLVPQLLVLIFEVRLFLAVIGEAVHEILIVFHFCPPAVCAATAGNTDQASACEWSGPEMALTKIRKTSNSIPWFTKHEM